MLRTAKTASALVGAGALVAALAGCASGSGQVGAAQEPVAVQPVAAHDVSADQVCAATANLQTVLDDETGLGRSQFSSTLQDRGPRAYAEGEVTVDETGTIVSYTVADGDVEDVVKERLCVGSGIASMNHVRMIYPGQVLWLNPDPETPVLPYFSPTDAPAGFSDIPYQQAMERMGLAIDAGNVDQARSIWNDELSAMFFNQAEIDSVVAALDAGDLDALRQMFS